jgi:N-acetylated-alpha-linked acidic dipeptidase
MLEAARGFGKLLQSGWRPKRTIKLIGWDAEEYGLIGSTYYAENAAQSELDKIVAYINLDTASTGPIFNAFGSPSLTAYLRYITTLLTDPNSGLSLYNVWAQRGANVGVLGSGSDYTAFLHHFGVPSWDLGFDGSYGVYHSAYDSFAWMSQYGDPGFKYHQLAAQLVGSLAIALADSSVAPIEYRDTATALQQYLNQTRNSLAAYNPSPVDLTPLQKSIDTFTKVANEANDYLTDFIAKNKSVKASKSVNEWLFAVEREFLDSAGLPGRPWYRHTLQAPGVFLGYGSQVFPGLAYAIDIQNWTLAAQQVTSISLRIDAAADQLADYGDSDSDNEGTVIAVVVVILVVAALIVAYFLSISDWAAISA